MLFLLSSVFPYSGFLVMFLIDDGSVDEENVGLYAGILTSSFMIGRALTAIHWGAMADTYGRKFVLLVTLTTSVVGSIAFGLSTTFYSALAVRFTMGLFNGTMVVVRTMISELAGGDKETESKGVALLFSMIGYSMLVSPAVGGLLSEPLTQYPDSTFFPMFGDLLSAFPFLIPNILAAVLSIVSLLLTIFGLEETLPEERCKPWTHMIHSLIERISKMISNAHYTLLSEHQVLEEEWSESFAIEATQRKADDDTNKWSKGEVANNFATEQTPLFKRTSHTSTSTLLDDTTEISKEASESFDFLNDSKLRILLVSYWVYTFTSVAQSEAFPLVAMSHNGGLGLNETSIGIIVAISGLIYCLGQYITFTTFLRHFGVVKTMRYGALGACLPLGLMPFGLYMTGLVQTLYLATIMGIILIFGNVFVGTSTMVTNQTVEPHQRARMNGVCGLGTSIARGAGPLFAGLMVSVVMSSTVIPLALSLWVIYGTLIIAGLFAYWTTLLVPEEIKQDYEDIEELDV
jgi:MFS family permease